MNEIEVFLDLNGGIYRVGTLRASSKRSKTTATFEYHPSWLCSPERFALEPALSVSEGIFSAGPGRQMFSSISDSAPDSWGRRLMQRKERRSATEEKRPEKILTEADYLLNVPDFTRMGALRFRSLEHSEFQSFPPARQLPTLSDLPQLLATMRKVLLNDETGDDLDLVTSCATSLGGARPKVSVIDADGHLCMAKFPKQGDAYNVEIWEEVAFRLAHQAGIQTPAHRLERVSGSTVLLSRRFDRTVNRNRIPFLSAMAMLGLDDGDRSSYPEIVDALRAHGDEVDKDVSELFRRMTFNVLVSNVDDHLRNHGFLWSGSGWKLSPVYDLNPVPADIRPRVLSTNINLDEGSCSVDLIRRSAEYFDLSLSEADQIVAEVATAVSNWRTVANRVGAKGAEIDRMESAFDQNELNAAMSCGGARVAAKEASE